MQKARVKLQSTSIDKIEEVADDVIDTAEKYDADYSGPVPLPTRTMEITTQRSPDGEGKETWERWEMRVHKRLIEMEDSERALRQVMRVNVPDGVNIQVEVL